MLFGRFEGGVFVGFFFFFELLLIIFFFFFFFFKTSLGKDAGVTFVRGEQDSRCLAAALEDLAVNVAASGRYVNQKRRRPARWAGGETLNCLKVPVSVVTGTLEQGTPNTAYLGRSWRAAAAWSDRRKAACPCLSPACWPQRYLLVKRRETKKIY